MTAIGTPSARAHPQLWLGTVTFGRWGNPDHQDCVRIIQRAIDRGVTGLDTAAAYADGESEEIAGKAIKGRRTDVLLATKYGYDNATGGPTSLSAADMRRSLDASLNRLGTDYVDVFFLHRVPASADRAELVAGLDALVQSGRARAIGTSMTSADDLEQLHDIRAVGGFAPIVWEQPPHSIFVRFIEARILPTCRRLGIKVASFAPLNGGLLAGKYHKGQAPPRGSRAQTWPIRRERFDFERPEVARNLALADSLTDIALQAGRTLEQLALDFSRSHPDVASVILGARTQEQLDQLLELGYRPLEPDVLAAIDRLVPPGSTVDDADILGYRT